MAGSPAEERIRAKVEAELRVEFPDARIVHELNMEQSGIRLDLAAVRPNAITLVEIKSERDVLKRLASQVKAALAITGDVRVYAAEKHRRAIADHLDQYARGDDGQWLMTWTELKAGRRQGNYTLNPDYIGHLKRARILIETEEGLSDWQAMHSSWWPRDALEHMADPRALLEMLWASELRQITGAAPKATRGYMKRQALESMTGSQIRAATCAALRGRPFARADPA